ncbi:MAG: transposase-like zinc-binding domain-containing protein [Janthinobacterium lividum]
MVYTQHLCAKCGSEHIRRNGTSQGHAKYQCKACGYQARFTPAAAAKAAQYAQVENLLVERNSQRSLVRATGVARVTVAKLLKKSAGSLPASASAAAQESAEKALGSVGTR